MCVRACVRACVRVCMRVCVYDLFWDNFLFVCLLELVPCGKFGQPYLGKVQQLQEQQYLYLPVYHYQCMLWPTSLSLRGNLAGDPAAKYAPYSNILGEFMSFSDMKPDLINSVTEL